MKRILASSAVVGLALAGMGTSSAAAPFDKVTGGGQIIADSSLQGPGATIAFTARNVGPDNLAQGQFQYNDHVGVKYHGTVSCLVVTGDAATFAGEITSGENAGGFFQVDVQDNGQGAEPNDLILLTNPDDADCDPSMDPTMELGRGNLQVHDAP